MIYNSKGLALLLALCIALVTTLFLSFPGSVNGNDLLVAFIITFTVGSLLIFVVLEFLFFREIKEIEKLLNKVRQEAPGAIKDQESGGLKLFKSIHENIYSFAGLKHREIDELRKQEEFRKDFIADVSHELKTPIFAAQGFVHTLLDGAVKDKAVRKKFLKKAAKSLDGLDRLVQDLLTLSNIETGRIKMHFEKIDLYTLTQEVMEQFEVKAEKKNINLHIEGPLRKVMVFADGQRITQVMTNLLSNAIKHSDKDAEVIVSFSATKKSVITQVTDYGEGIPKEHINRIFERFYRVDKSRSREKGGTGLGLAIVKHILEGHNSKTRVESTPGKGSTFGFKLPRVRSEKEENTEIQESAKH